MIYRELSRYLTISLYGMNIREGKYVASNEIPTLKLKPFDTLLTKFKKNATESDYFDFINAIQMFLQHT